MPNPCSVFKQELTISKYRGSKMRNGNVPWGNNTECKGNIGIAIVFTSLSIDPFRKLAGPSEVLIGVARLSDPVHELPQNPPNPVFFLVCDKNPDMPA